MATISDLRDLVRPEEGQVSRLIFTDPEIYQWELERIFTRCWLYVAHESEIPHPGDYVTRIMGGDPVVVARGKDGKIRVFLNTCRHRGARVCRDDSGNAPQFRCPYHGWTYENTGELIGIPAYKLAYPHGLDLSRLGLHAAPKVDTYHSLVFASWDAQAESLADYLGGIRWYLDLLFGRTDSGVEIVGPPQRWEVETNWKLPAANFAGDAYHGLVTHGYRAELGGPPSSSYGHQVHTEKGHGVGLTLPAPGAPNEPYFSLPKELWPQFERHLTKEQLEVMRPLRNIHGTVFPNLSFLHPATKRAPEDPYLVFFTLRQWQPKGPDKIEIWSWCLVEKDTPESWKEASRQAYSQNFGMAGTTEQDDTETWADVAQTNSGPVARRLTFHYGMGLGSAEPVKGWPGPGVAYATAWIEANERAFYKRWLELIQTT